MTEIKKIKCWVIRLADSESYIRYIDEHGEVYYEDIVNHEMIDYQTIKFIENEFKKYTDELIIECTGECKGCESGDPKEQKCCSFK